MLKVYGPSSQNAAPTPSAPPRNNYFIDVAAENAEHARQRAKASRAPSKARGVDLRDADSESASYISFCKKQNSNNSHEITPQGKKQRFSWAVYNRRSRAKRALTAFWSAPAPPTAGRREPKHAVTQYTFTDPHESDNATPVSGVQHRLAEYFRRHHIDAQMVRILGAKRGTHYLIVRVPENIRLPHAHRLWDHGEAESHRLTCSPVKRCLELIKATKRHALAGRGRLYDVSRSALSETTRRLMRWAVLPEWLRAKTQEGEVLTRVRGGGWTSEYGDFYPSPWKRHSWRKPDGTWGEKFVRIDTPQPWWG